MVSPDHYITLTAVHLWQNGTGWKGGDRPAGDPKRERPGMTWALPHLCWPSRRFALIHHRPGPMVVLPDGSRAPSGGGCAGDVLPCRYMPADANGGFCIGRSCADALGAWGPSATKKLRRVYTGALLTTTISGYRCGLNVVSIDGILYSTNENLFGGLK